ncbi:hypothetical protein [Rubrivivax sp. JA1026]|uniref:hypothetical protein n=1 Tax=Rubrivivax sp. JA1026 TaxID=2710888 RepID=UPI0013E99A4A|nr:hypothetical protein [Rubrivivax sp. JA1026]
MTTEKHLYNWMLPDPRRPGRMYRSRWKMTEETAQGYPGAVRIDDSLEIRRGIDRSHRTSDFMAPSPPSDDDAPA